VQTLDGRWLSIDGRVLFKANVAASETYNTALEQHLRDTLGVRFAERPGTDPGKRPIREIPVRSSPAVEGFGAEVRVAFLRPPPSLHRVRDQSGLSSDREPEGYGVNISSGVSPAALG
jgi:hypothetical protein